MKIEGNIGKTEVLSVGDRITCGVTHQIRIGGEDSWIKWEIDTAVRDGETEEQAVTRVLDHVDARAMEAVHRVVDTVRKVNR